MTSLLASPHLVVLPIVLPLASAALLLLLEALRPRWARTASWVAPASTVALAGVAALLLVRADAGTVHAYLLSNWQAPWGIALALDRLAALMLTLTALVALPALAYAQAATVDRGPHFHALFQLQLMGLNGAFLSADLFNLFVFFEVLLAASYGLLLHGHGDGQRQRLRAGLHYVVFNLVGSALFLVAASLLYGVLGSLNLADLARKWPLVSPAQQALAQAAALLLLTVFAVKAALLPLYFWLPATYAAAAAPVAALFALLTKVGVYAVLRVGTLIVGSALAAPWLQGLALATLVLAGAGAVAATRLRALLGYGVVASAGTLLLAAGLGTPASVAAGLFYLVGSTLTAAAGFLLADLLCRARGTDRLVPAPLGSAWATLGLCFALVAVSLAGLPPLAGFMGKAWLLQAAVQAPPRAPALPWTLLAVLASSLLMLLALARAGIALFWSPTHGVARPLHVTPGERGATAVLLVAVLACAAAAAPLARYATATAQQLFERAPYIDAVLGQRPVPPAHDLRREMRERGQTK